MIPKGTTVHRNYPKYAIQVGFIVHPKTDSLGKKRFDIFDIAMNYFTHRNLSKNCMVGVIIDELRMKAQGQPRVHRLVGKNIRAKVHSACDTKIVTGIVTQIGACNVLHVKLDHPVTFGSGERSYSYVAGDTILVHRSELLS